MDRSDNQFESLAGGRRTPDAALADAVAQVHAGLDALAAIDPAELTEFTLGDQVASLLTARRRVDGATAVFAGEETEFNEYVATIREEHRRRPSFMAAPDRAGL
jgi:hypothetical protein